MTLNRGEPPEEIQGRGHVGNSIVLRAIVCSCCTARLWMSLWLFEQPVSSLFLVPSKTNSAPSRIANLDRTWHACEWLPNLHWPSSSRNNVRIFRTFRAIKCNHKNIKTTFSCENLNLDCCKTPDSLKPQHQHIPIKCWDTTLKIRLIIVSRYKILRMS